MSAWWPFDQDAVDSDTFSVAIGKEIQPESYPKDFVKHVTRIFLVSGEGTDAANQTITDKSVANVLTAFGSWNGLLPRLRDNLFELYTSSTQSDYKIYEFWHGNKSSGETKRILDAKSSGNGNFLLRLSSAKQVCISFLDETVHDGVRHILIEWKDGTWLMKTKPAVQCKSLVLCLNHVSNLLESPVVSISNYQRLVGGVGGDGGGETVKPAQLSKPQPSKPQPAQPQPQPQPQPKLSQPQSEVSQLPSQVASQPPLQQAQPPVQPPVQQAQPPVQPKPEPPPAKEGSSCSVL